MAEHTVTFEVIETQRHEGTIEIDDTLWEQLFEEPYDPATVSGEKVQHYVSTFGMGYEKRTSTLRAVWRNANAAEAERHAAEQAAPEAFLEGRLGVWWEETQTDLMHAADDSKWANQALTEIADSRIHLAERRRIAREEAQAAQAAAAHR